MFWELAAGGAGAVMNMSVLVAGFKTSQATLPKRAIPRGFENIAKAAAGAAGHGGLVACPGSQIRGNSPVASSCEELCSPWLGRFMGVRAEKW